MQANEDDGSCVIEPDAIFGGIFANTTVISVNCEHDRSYNDRMIKFEEELWNELKVRNDEDKSFVRNIITGEMKCPVGFEAVLLYSKNSTLFGINAGLLWDIKPVPISVCIRFLISGVSSIPKA